MEILIGLAIGLASSGVVGLLMYFQQRREHRESFERLLGVIESGRINAVASTMMMVDDTRKLMGEVRELRAKVNGISSTIAPLAPPRYAQAARVIADQMEPQIRASAPPSRSLTLQSVRLLHEQLFTKGFAPAGKFRKVQVWIRPQADSPESAKFTPPPPGEVAPRLRELLAGWNALSPQLQEASKEDKIEAIAKFHHELVSIHPFADGNGVLARLITAIQIRDLVGVDRPFVVHGEEYVQALEAADGGDLAHMTGLVRRHVEEHAIKTLM